MWQQLIEKKIFDSYKAASHVIAAWQYFGEKIVFTNGCFDILHQGHLSYLMEAKELGGKLVIGLNNDFSVKAIKGNNRPINPQESRAFLLASLSFVDAVILFEEETPVRLIEQIRPAILVKGSDYAGKTIVGAEFVKSYQGEVILLDFLPDHSTTSIVEKIQSLK